VGTGPGEITGAGCAVDFYALLPPFGEAEIVHSAVPEGASIQELGCGTGRILRPLAGLGHQVLGVDDSRAMLARIPDLPTVCCRIEGRREPPRLFIEVEYQVGDRVWTHSWGAWEISERELADDLRSTGLRFGRWLTDDHAWFTADAA
jgi:SAM-dependent methyltransferase